LGEKWFVDSASNSYFILPDGNLYRWDNSNLAACTLVASLAPSYATDPTTLFEAQAGGGPASVSVTGTTLVVMPDAGFVGVFYITVLVDAGSGGTTTGQFEVTVGSSSSPPLVTSSLVSTVQHGSLIFNSDGSFIYTPAAGFYGVDSFAYQASDGSKTSGIAAAALDVTDVHAPVAVDGTYTVPHDTTLVVSSVPAGVLGNDTDADGDSLTASLVTGPSEGTLTLNADGTFDYVPDAGFYGQDFFTYQASDGARSSNVATVFINITPTGSSVPLTPDALFTDDFSASTLDPAWQPTGGTWSIDAGILSQTSTDAGGSYKLLNIMTFPADLELTAKVRVDSWSGTDAAWAGVGLDCDPTTRAGYNLVLQGNNTVAFLDDNTGTWGNSYAFSWSVGTWYDFALEVVGSTLYGSIWADGTAQPATWMFQQTGWTDATGGAPALDGGTGGNATASFQDVAVTYAPDAPDDYAAPPVIDSPATASEDDVTGNSTELRVGAEVPGDNDHLEPTPGRHDQWVRPDRPVRPQRRAAVSIRWIPLLR